MRVESTIKLEGKNTTRMTMCDIKLKSELCHSPLNKQSYCKGL